MRASEPRPSTSCNCATESVATDICAARMKSQCISAPSEPRYFRHSSRSRRSDSVASSRERCRNQPTTVSLSRSEEHTSELQSQSNLVCRLLLEKKKKKKE